jgi:hypothetical protein
MKIHYCKTQLKPIFSASRPLSLIIMAIIIITLLDSPLSTSLNSYAQTSARVTGRPQPTSTNAVIPKASIQWSPKIRPGFFEQVNERYLILNGKSQINNPNFKFFSDQWYQKTHGTVLVVKFTGRNTNPSSVAIKLINVLNAKPGTRQTFKELRLGDTITTLPFAPGDNMQQRHFLISNDVASGYYILNLIVNFGSHLSIVYTGKVFVPAAKTPVGATAHSTTVVRATAKARASATAKATATAGPTIIINCPSTQHFDDNLSKCIDNTPPIPIHICNPNVELCDYVYVPPVLLPPPIPGPSCTIPGQTYDTETASCVTPPHLPFEHCSTSDASGNCLNLPAQKPTTCSDGSTPDANGNCPPTNPNLNQPPCIDNPAVGSICPTSPPPLTSQSQGGQQLCPDGSPPADDGSCPPPPPHTPTQQPVDPCVQDPSAPGCSTTPPSPYSWYGSSNERQEST